MKYKLILKWSSIVIIAILIIYSIYKIFSSKKEKKEYYYIGMRPAPLPVNWQQQISDQFAKQRADTKWFDDLVVAHPGMKQYYERMNNTNDLAYTVAPDGDARGVGKLLANGKIELADGSHTVVDASTKLVLEGPPPPFRSVWLKAFLANNEGAKKFGNRLTVSNNVLYLDGTTNLGYTDDDHTGLIRPSYKNTTTMGNQFIPIDVIFGLIGGSSSSDECFDFLGIGNFFKNSFESAYNFVKDRVVGPALDWLKKEGEGFIKTMIDIGNKIGCYARKWAVEIYNTAKDTINKIKDFFVGIYDKVKDFVLGAVNYIYDNIIKLVPDIWNKYIKPALGNISNFITGGALCEYKVSRNLSRLEAVQTIQPVIMPVLSEALTQVVKDTIEVAAGASIALSPFIPFLELIYPLVDPYIQDQLVPLFIKLSEVDFMVTALTEMVDNTALPLADGSVCGYLNYSGDSTDFTLNSNESGEGLDDSGWD
jgi:hypothetical protein